MTHAFNTHMTQSSSSFNAHAPHTESQTTNRTPALNDREKFIESAQTPIRKNQRKKRRTKNTQKKKLIHFLRRCLFPCVWKFDCMFSMCVCVFFLLLLFRYFTISPCAVLVDSCLKGLFFHDQLLRLLAVCSDLTVRFVWLTQLWLGILFFLQSLLLHCFSSFLFFFLLRFLICVSLLFNNFIGFSLSNQKRKKKDFFLINFECCFFFIWKIYNFAYDGKKFKSVWLYTAVQKG